MKQVAAPTKFLSAANLAGNFTSSPVNVLQADVVSFQMNYTGSSPTGNIIVQGSLDGVNYAPIPFQLGATTVATLALPAATSPVIISISNFNVQYVRLNYAFTSGTGSLDAYISFKRIGD